MRAAGGWRRDQDRDRECDDPDPGPVTRTPPPAARGPFPVVGDRAAGGARRPPVRLHRLGVTVATRRGRWRPEGAAPWAPGPSPP